MPGLAIDVVAADFLHRPHIWITLVPASMQSKNRRNRDHIASASETGHARLELEKTLLVYVVF